MSNATTTKRFFSRETEVSTLIKASPQKVWDILTNVSEFDSWNSTVQSFKGKLEDGGVIELISVLSPKRTFKLKVKEFDSPNRLVWGDAMGERIFELKAEGDNTRFTMHEKIGGPLFPLFSRMIPDFNQSFDDFAADLAEICITD